MEPHLPTDFNSNQKMVAMRKMDSRSPQSSTLLAWEAQSTVAHSLPLTLGHKLMSKPPMLRHKISFLSQRRAKSPAQTPVHAHIKLTLEEISKPVTHRTTSLLMDLRTNSCSLETTKSCRDRLYFRVEAQKISKF